MINNEPYYEIEYVENGEMKNGYASSSLEIISSYIRQYFILQSGYERQEYRKRGKWIKIHWKAFRCSVCSRVSEYNTNFCPNCGADMRDRFTTVPKDVYEKMQMVDLREEQEERIVASPIIHPLKGE
jgi:rubrerythrin